MALGRKNKDQPLEETSPFGTPLTDFGNPESVPEQEESAPTKRGLSLRKKSGPKGEVATIDDDPSQGQPGIPLTSFDFLENKWRLDKGARLKQNSILAGCMAAVVLAAFIGLSSKTAAKNSEEELATTNSRLAASTAELTAVSNVSGYTAEELEAHLIARSADIAIALAGETDVFKIINDIRANTPPGMQVVSLNIQQPPLGAPAPPPVDPALAPAPTAPGAGPTPGAATVSMVVQGSGLSSVTAWINATKKMTTLTNFTTNWNGSESVTVTSSAEVAAPGFTLRDAALGQRLTSTFGAVAGAAPAPAPGAPAAPPAAVPPAAVPPATAPRSN